MKENKSVFLKVDYVEPVLKGGGICSRETYLDAVKVWIGDYVFGNHTVLDILNRRSYEQIVEMLKDWKKEKETIRVRDEVYSNVYEVRFVVTKICFPSGGEDATVNGLKKDGTAVKGLLLCNVKKTGLHVDDLDSYLEV